MIRIIKNLFTAPISNQGALIGVLVALMFFMMGGMVALNAETKYGEEYVKLNIGGETRLVYLTDNIEVNHNMIRALVKTVNAYDKKLDSIVILTDINTENIEKSIDALSVNLSHIDNDYNMLSGHYDDLAVVYDDLYDTFKDEFNKNKFSGIGLGTYVNVDDGKITPGVKLSHISRMFNNMFNIADLGYDWQDNSFTMGLSIGYYYQ